MTDQGQDMSELLVLKTAAQEAGVDPSHLRHEILLGKLPADKFGGRDWWIRRGDLLAWHAQRRPVGAPRSTPEDEAEEKERSWRREYQRQYRERQKQAAKETAPPGKSRGKTGKRG